MYEYIGKLRPEIYLKHAPLPNCDYREMPVTIAMPHLDLPGVCLGIANIVESVHELLTYGNFNNGFKRSPVKNAIFISTQFLIR